MVIGDPAKIGRQPDRAGRANLPSVVWSESDPGVEAPVKSISIRLPREMLNELKVLANKKDIPYQSLIKVYLAEKIAEERKAS